ncbi:hypothetical protein [Streptomyces ipomoeae]|uniref:hypothetical protein n=1 Tax=Streptomyces ipomoeae TaxID=103232 RepID=UPI0029C0EB8D|nr:hypothetical protein [Streptomyces ipomoeae]
MYVEPGLTPLAAREANRNALTSLLDSVGVPYFAVRGTSDHGTVVAVAVQVRARGATAARGGARAGQHVEQARVQDAG